MSELDAKDRHHLKDSQYAFPKERKEPIEDASHVRNAIVKKAAKKHGVEIHEKSWREFGKKKD